MVNKVKLSGSDAELVEIALHCAKFEDHLLDKRSSYGKEVYIGDGSNYRNHLHTIRSYLIHGLKVDLEYHENNDVADVTFYGEGNETDKKVGSVVTELSEFVRENLKDEKRREVKERIDLARKLSCLC